MTFHEDILSIIGHTPLIKLKSASEKTGCTILGKAEFLNPGQSVKDRAAKSILLKALERGDIKKGGCVVEGTAGNTGIGLAIISRVLGFRCVIVIPESQSNEKKLALRLAGAELYEVPAVPYKDPNNYIKVSGRLAELLNKEEENGALWANQFDNQDNRLAHVETTGPEIWNTLEGKVDGFICAAGTGGTIAGVGMALKERDADVTIALADPMGAALHHYYTHGTLKSEGSSITEGIGQGRITRNLEDAPIDRSYQISDQSALDILDDLVENEGLCLGGSSGVNIAGAMALARDLGPGHVIATVLCDYGQRYASKLFNKNFLEEKKLRAPSFLNVKKSDLISRVLA